MDESAFKWICRQRRIFSAQLNLINGQRNPFEGAADFPIFTDTNEARNALSGWIVEIDGLIGPEDLKPS